VPKLIIGVMVGLVLGALDALPAFRNVNLRPIAVDLLMGGIIKGALTGGVAGAVAARTRRFPPTLLAGVGTGILLTIVAWIASHEIGRPGVLPSIAIGGVAAVVTLRWGH
jgi:hypothetical protein